MPMSMHWAMLTCFSVDRYWNTATNNGIPNMSLVFLATVFESSYLLPQLLPGDRSLAQSRSTNRDTGTEAERVDKWNGSNVLGTKQLGLGEDAMGGEEWGPKGIGFALLLPIYIGLGSTHLVGITVLSTGHTLTPVRTSHTLTPARPRRAWAQILMISADPRDRRYWPHSLQLVLEELEYTQCSSAKTSSGADSH
ncbi:hypothetical protein P691DRAFT_791754, partial [Macrolepiota fuliginosa MF-IS2]